MKQRVKSILFYFCIIYIAIVGGLYFGQWAMIYFPAKYKPDITPYVSAGLYEARTQTSDGLTLSSWVRDANEGKETLVRFHGNAYNHEGSLYKASPFISDGYGFLSVGYRGYNSDEGKPSERGFYKDARAWIDYLIASGVPQEELVLYGESVGTGVAVQMATEYPNIKAVVLEAPYTSFPDVAKRLYFFAPVALLMKDRYDNLSKIKDVKAPLLIMYGSEDNIIPPKLSKRLFEAANDPKQIVEIEGHGHNDMPIERLALETVTFIEAL